MSASHLSPEKPRKAKDSSSEEHLRNIIMMAEIGIDLKDRCTVAEKYMTHLKMLFSQAKTTIDTLQATSKYSLQLAKKMLNGSAAIAANAHIKNDYERLLGVIDRQLNDFDDLGDMDLENDEYSSAYIAEKIKFLEARQKFDHNLPPSGSNRSVKCDVDEKYPENWSRDSSIDLSTVVNLPPVPEDVFTSFNSLQKPKRSSSLSSLKSMRKVKLFLQRAETSDDEEISSENEDNECATKLFQGDSDEANSPKKLCNIKEETQD